MKMINTKNYFELNGSNVVTFDINTLNNFPLSQKECIILVNLEKDSIIFQKGVQNVLGYDRPNENQENFLLKYCHPDDYDLIEKIISSTLKFSNRNIDQVSENKLFISLRLRKKDKSYVKVFCKISVISTDQNDRISSVLIVMTDVSFMDTDNFVKWNFEARNLNSEEFKKSIYKSFDDIFTVREIEVIKEVCKKIATEEIAKNLFISRHTVATHRKNILKKSKCHSVNELINFCNAIGINTLNE